jgi:hypothetical protein
VPVEATVNAPLASEPACVTITLDEVLHDWIATAADAPVGQRDFPGGEPAGWDPARQTPIHPISGGQRRCAFRRIVNT